MLRTIGGFLGICQAPVAQNRHPLSSARDERVSAMAVSKFKVVDISSDEMNAMIEAAKKRLNNIPADAKAITKILMENFIVAKSGHADLLRTKLIEFFSDFETVKVIELEKLTNGDNIRFCEGAFDLFFTFIENNRKYIQQFKIPADSCARYMDCDDDDFTAFCLKLNDLSLLQL